MRRYAIAPVMDGYSIKEAATVLGVPKRRVWELIARGVLSGAP
jgi:excisionase family DNA binding protein